MYGPSAVPSPKIPAKFPISPINSAIQIVPNKNKTGIKMATVINIAFKLNRKFSLDLNAKNKSSISAFSSLENFKK